MVKSNSWHFNNNSNTVFVFIHGFFSNSSKCWTSKEGVYWPELISTDRRFGNPSIFMADYYTDVDSRRYLVSDCANEVLTELRRPGLLGEPAVLEKKNIVFVCHSLGGIVARYMLERNREYFIDKAVCMVLIASPSYGSDYADRLSKIIGFYKNGIAAQLKSANGSLQDLDDRFRDLVQRRIVPKLVGAEAVEHHFLFHFKFLPGFSPVVSKESASRYFGAGKILANTDHSTCVKPDNHEHVVHKFLTTTFIELFLPIAFPNSNENSDGDNKDSSQKTLQPPDPLFEVYNTADKPFYLEREIDAEISKRLKMFSVWLYGNSGVGKTACTRYEVLNKDNLTGSVQVYIGAITKESVTHIDLLNEIYYTICGVVDIGVKPLDSAHKIIEEIGNLLSIRKTTAGVFLVIDEIPQLDNPHVEIPRFLQSLISLISCVKRITQEQNISIIVNSIFDPTEYIVDPKQKISEQFKFIKLNEWDPIELANLFDVIVEGLPIQLSEDEKKHILNGADGLPRIVKNGVKNLLSFE